MYSPAMLSPCLAKTTREQTQRSDPCLSCFPENPMEADIPPLGLAMLENREAEWAFAGSRSQCSV